MESTTSFSSIPACRDCGRSSSHSGAHSRFASPTSSRQRWGDSHVHIYAPFCMPCFISGSLNSSGGKSVCAQTPASMGRRTNARGKQTQPTVPALWEPALCAYKASTRQAPLAIVPLSLRARDIDGGISLEYSGSLWLTLTNISNNHANILQY